MGRRIAWLLGSTAIVVGVVALSAPVWADGSEAPAPSDSASAPKSPSVPWGPTGVKVPNVMRLPVDEAVSILESVGLSAKTDMYTKSREPTEDVVTCQMPEAGTIVDAGDTVRLVVGQWPPQP